MRIFDHLNLLKNGSLTAEKMQKIEEIAEYTSNLREKFGVETQLHRGKDSIIDEFII